jgi:hypothetical protein
MCLFWNKLYVRRAVKKFPEFLDIDTLAHHQFVPPGAVLLVTSTCEFCRGCAMRLRGSGETSGRDSGAVTASR